MITYTDLHSVTMPIIAHVLSKAYDALTVEDFAVLRDMNMSPVHSCLNNIVQSKRETQVETSPALLSVLEDIGNMSIVNIMALNNCTRTDAQLSISLYSSPVETRVYEIPSWMYAVIILSLMHQFITNSYLLTLSKISSGGVK